MAYRAGAPAVHPGARMPLAIRTLLTWRWQRVPCWENLAKLANVLRGTARHVFRPTTIGPRYGRQEGRRKIYSKTGMPGSREGKRVHRAHEMINQTPPRLRCLERS